MATSPERTHLKTTNPTSYPAKPLVIGSLIVIYILVAITKVIILMLNEPFIGRSKIPHSAKPSSNFSTFIKFVFWGNMLINHWYFSWLLRSQKEGVRRLTLRDVAKDWAFYFFLADALILGITPFLLGYPSDTNRKQVILVVFSIIPCGLAYFYLINSYHIFGYNPNAHCSNYILDSAYLEFEGTPKTWKIKDTGAFRIVLENAGLNPVPVGEIFTVERLVEWQNEIQSIHTGMRMAENRLHGRFNTYVKFVIKLEEEVPVGDNLVLIPYGHIEPGAIQVEDYRSFGNVKGITTTTSVYDEQEKLLAKFTQKYREPEPGEA